MVTSRDRAPAPWLYALVAALVATQAAAIVAGLAGAGDRSVSYDIVVGAATSVAAPLLLRFPAAGTVVCSVLAALSPAATPAAAVGALFTAHGRPLRTAVPVALAGIAAHVVQGVLRPSGGIEYGWWLLLIVAAYGTLVGWGSLDRSRLQRVRAADERVRRVEAEQELRLTRARLGERARIAREMHDVLAHRLSIIATYAGALEYRPDSAPERLSRAAGVVRSGARQALEELRQVIGVLDEDTPAPDQPRPSLADLPHLIAEARDAGTEVRYQTTVQEGAEPPAAHGRAVYRIVQEGLTNARKHAPGLPVDVTIEGAPGTGISVDLHNPTGTGPSDLPGAGTGLIGLAERADLVGGRLEHTDTSEGFRLHAWLPWPG